MNRPCKYVWHMVAGAAVFLGLSMIVAPQVRAAEIYELTLDSAILYALDNNPERGIAAEKTVQAAHSVDEVKANYYPQVEANVLYGTAYDDPASFKQGSGGTGSDVNQTTDMTFTVNQLLFDGFSTPAEIERRKKLEESAAIFEELTEEDLILRTVEAYTRIYQLQHSLRDAEGYFSRLSEIEKTVKMQQEAGAEDDAKLKFVNARTAFARAELSNTKAALTDAITDLEFLTGHLPDFAVVMPDFWDVLAYDAKAYWQKAYEQNSAMQRQAAERAALESELDRNQGGYYPTLSFINEFNQTHDSGGDIGRQRAYTAQLQLNYKIFDGFATKAAVDRSRSAIKEIDYEIEKQKKELKQDIKRSYNQVVAIEQDMEITRKEQEANRALQKLSMEQFMYGEGDIINLVEGEERLYNSQSKTHRLAAELIRNVFALIQQAGMLDKNRFCRSC